MESWKLQGYWTHFPKSAIENMNIKINQSERILSAYLDIMLLLRYIIRSLNKYDIRRAHTNKFYLLHKTCLPFNWSTNELGRATP